MLSVSGRVVSCDSVVSIWARKAYLIAQLLLTAPSRDFDSAKVSYEIWQRKQDIYIIEKIIFSKSKNISIASFMSLQYCKGKEFNHFRSFLGFSNPIVHWGIRGTVVFPHVGDCMLLNIYNFVKERISLISCENLYPILLLL